MTIEQLRKAHQAKPFAPFSMRTGDGREYRIPSPEFLFITPNPRTVVVADTDGAVEVVDLLLVTSLHFDSPQPRRTRGGNGRKV